MSRASGPFSSRRTTCCRSLQPRPPRGRPPSRGAVPGEVGPHDRAGPAASVTARDKASTTSSSARRRRCSSNVVTSAAAASGNGQAGRAADRVGGRPVRPGGPAARLDDVRPDKGHPCLAAVTGGAAAPARRRRPGDRRQGSAVGGDRARLWRGLARPASGAGNARRTCARSRDHGTGRRRERAGHRIDTPVRGGEDERTGTARPDHAEVQRPRQMPTGTSAERRERQGGQWTAGLGPAGARGEERAAQGDREPRWRPAGAGPRLPRATTSKQQSQQAEGDGSQGQETFGEGEAGADVGRRSTRTKVTVATRADGGPGLPRPRPDGRRPVARAPRRDRHGPLSPRRRPADSRVFHTPCRCQPGCATAGPFLA